ncbi:hypothetical protein GGS26DRAFT_412813 [Hypomontagnella submonticulosa]|nr:hypothetical protein GGS26DRAFT_412813 [Hypomontagnella submonticulosa]
MDPFTAFGVACNVITVVDAAVKCGRTIAELYNSTSGYTKETEGLLKAAGDWEAIDRDMRTAQAQIPETESYHKMHEAVTDCVKASQRINEILASCRAGNGSSLRSAMKGFLKSAVKKSEIYQLRDQLEQSASRMTSLVAATTRSDVAQIMARLEQTRMNHELFTQKLDGLKAQLDKVASHEELLEAITSIGAVSHDAMEEVNQYHIVQSLHSRFPTAKARFDAVDSAEAGTFSWIFEDPESLLDLEPDLEVDLPEWLSSGLGVFHIAGRPGSGKSTLMKYLTTHPETTRLLTEWAGEKKLLFANSFLWRLGSDDQKSWRGLVGNLLYDTVRQMPSLTKLLFTDYWKSESTWLNIRANSVLPITDADIRAAFDKLINDSEVHEKFRICFFIDGLDEFDEPTTSYWTIAERIRKWSETSSDNVKLCVSSREYQSIEQAFVARQRIHLHRLTARDITHLVWNRLDTNPFFIKLSEKEGKECDKLIDRITYEAQGVFLWVVLLLKLLEEELASRAETVSTSHLNEVVTSTPTELEQFVVRIIETIPSHNRAKSMLLLAMALRVAGLPLETEVPLKHPWQRHLPWLWDNFRSITLTGISLYFEPQLPSLPSLPVELVEKRRESGASLINSWSRGLLVPYGLYAVFSHRSIPEILQGILRKGKEPNITDETVFEAILELTVAELKFCMGAVFTTVPGWVAYIAHLHTTRQLTARMLTLLHSMEEVVDGATPDESWVRRNSMTRIASDQTNDPASVLNNAARFGLHEYVLWEIDNHLSYPQNKNRLEVLLAYATVGAMEFETDKSVFECILDSCVKKWKDASPSPSQPFPWALTWLDFVCQFVFWGTPLIPPENVGWSILESWLQLGLSCPFTLTVSRPWEGLTYPYQDKYVVPEDEGFAKPRVWGAPKETGLHIYGELSPKFQEIGLWGFTYYRNLSSLPNRGLPDLVGKYKTLEELCQGFWDFAHADGRNGRLTLRDLVVFHNPANCSRLLELIDKNGDQDMGLHAWDEEVIREQIKNKANPFWHTPQGPGQNSSELYFEEVQVSEENDAVPAPVSAKLRSVIYNRQFLGALLALLVAVVLQYVFDYI